MPYGGGSWPKDDNRGYFVCKYTYICAAHEYATSRHAMGERPPRCPTCRKPMKNMGFNFKTPKKGSPEWKRLPKSARPQSPRR